MRFIAVWLAICALSPAALAEPSRCNSISNPSGRLACYNGARPLGGAVARRPVTGPVVTPKAENSAVLDAPTAEEAIVSARMNGICRGC